MHVQEIVHAALALLDELQTEDAMQSESGKPAAAAADVACIFEALLCGNRNRQLFDWDSGPHAVTKALWQQRAFAEASEIVLQVSGPTIADNLLMLLHGQDRKVLMPTYSVPCMCVLQRLQEAKQGKIGQQAAQADLLLCLARLIRGAPPAVVRAQHAQLLPWVLAALQDAKVGDDEQAVTALLLTVSEALMDPAGAHALHMLPALIGIYQGNRPAASQRACTHASHTCSHWFLRCVANRGMVHAWCMLYAENAAWTRPY